MKRITILIYASILLFSCSKEDAVEVNPQQTESQKQFLVNKIFDFNYNLVAEYIYNKKNQLIKRIFTDSINQASSDYDFEYLNNRVSEIIYTDHTYPQFNHSISIYYNIQGEIIKDETYQYGNLIRINNYTYYSNGRIMGIVDVSGVGGITYIYNNTNNIEQIRIIPSDTALPERYLNYQFDNKKKPNCGINQIFQFEPLPGFGNDENIQRNASQNNMTEFMESGTKWIYEYNEFNLPTSIETIWDGVVLTEPIMLRIEYKEI